MISNLTDFTRVVCDELSIEHQFNISSRSNTLAKIIIVYINDRYYGYTNAVLSKHLCVSVQRISQLRSDYEHVIAQDFNQVLIRSIVSKLMCNSELLSIIESGIISSNVSLSKSEIASLLSSIKTKLSNGYNDI